MNPSRIAGVPRGAPARDSESGPKAVEPTVDTAAYAAADPTADPHGREALLRMGDEEFRAAFEAGRVEPAAFDHRAHLRAAYTELGARRFLEACIALRDGLTHIAARAGKPGLYHETITVAFMSLLAERRARGSWPDAAAFIDDHPELSRRELLAIYYHPDELADPVARERFVLSRRRPSGSPS